MQIQARLPFLPPTATTVSEHLALERSEGFLTFFDASGPIYCCRKADVATIRMAAVTLTDPKLGLASPKQMADALGIHRTRVFAYRKAYEREGLEGIRPRRTGPRGAYKLVDELLAQAQRLLNEGRPNREIARQLGISEGIIRVALKQGRLQRQGDTEAPAALEQAEPGAGAGGAASGGAAAPQSTADAPRVDLSAQEDGGAPEGGQGQAGSTPRVRSVQDEGCAQGMGVKRVEERALAAVGKLGEAAPAFPCAQSVPGAGVLVALPVLLGQGLVEVGEQVYGSLKNGFFGLRAVLLTLAFMALLRIKCIEDLPGFAPGELGILLGLDRAPEIKTLRRKLKEMKARGVALSFARSFAERWATEDPEVLGYLYVDGHVRPYNGRRHRLPKTHVQRRRLCMPATTDYWVNDACAEPLFFVTAAANDGLLAMLDGQVLPEVRRLIGPERRVTIVFDREGWSPERFGAWQALGIDVLTYRKGRYEAWPEQSFFAVTERVRGKEVTYRLAERSVLVRKGTVPNPARKHKRQELQRLVRALAQAEQEYGQHAEAHPEDCPATMLDFKTAHATVAARIRQLRTDTDTLKAEIRGLPVRVAVRELRESSEIVKLESERKVITDTVKMVAYRAETQLANLIGPLLPSRDDEARSFLKKLFQLPADILPQPEHQRLLVRLHSMADWRSNRAVHALCQVLNYLQTPFPGTNLTLVFEAFPSPE